MIGKVYKKSENGEFLALCLISCPLSFLVTCLMLAIPSISEQLSSCAGAGSCSSITLGLFYFFTVWPLFSVVIIVMAEEKGNGICGPINITDQD